MNPAVDGRSDCVPSETCVESICSSSAAPSPAGEWFLEPIYGHFWSNYIRGQQWISAHLNLAHHQQIHHPHQPNDHERKRSVSAAKKEKKEEAATEEEAEEFISDEYLQFALETRRHRKEREQLRVEKAKAADRVVYKDISQVTRSWRPSKVPGRGEQASSSSKSLSHMICMYGPDGGPKIAAQEARMQAKFDQLSDLHQPKLWPTIPIKINFKALNDLT
jgi:hypothetical protein